MNPQIIYVIRRSGYTEAQKRATYRYIEKNKDTVKEKNHLKYVNRIKPMRDAFLELCRIEV